jgi:hypothetical protein
MYLRQMNRRLAMDAIRKDHLCRNVLVVNFSGIAMQ